MRNGHTITIRNASSDITAFRVRAGGTAAVRITVCDRDSAAPEGVALISGDLGAQDAERLAAAILDAAGKGWMLRAAKHVRDYARDIGQCVLCTIGGDDAPNKASHEDFCPLSKA